MIVGLDAGNHEIKVCSASKVSKLLSVLGEYRERRLVQTFDDDQDIEYEFNGRKGFAGTLALYESEFAASVMGNTKVHDDTLVRVLLGLTNHSAQTNFRLVVGQPISKHVPDDKEKLINMLVGTHTITVNGVTHEVNIEDVKVAAEGAAAFWSAPKRGLVRVLDFGSGTVNGATIKDGKFIDKESFTIGDGLNTIKSGNVEAFVRKVCLEAKSRNHWHKGDTVLLTGGAAEVLVELVAQYFWKADFIKPQHSKGHVSPVYANAVGFHTIAEKVFK